MHDILTCGTCQKTFALAEIVKFIQHKVLQCNKENYGQCFTQGNLKHMIMSLIEMYNVSGGTPALSGTTTNDRDSDDGRPLSLTNSRRPSISAPMSRKSSTSRVHSPPLASPSSHILEDGSTSTPKRLSEGKSYQTMCLNKRLTDFIKTHNIDNDTGVKRPDSVASSLDCKDNDVDNKRDSMEIKREGSVHLDDDYNSLPPLKRLRAEVADAESNTTNSGEF